MFGKKQENQLPQSNIVVNTIPEDFYGGKNPVVNFKNVTTDIDIEKGKKSVLTAREKKIFDKQTSVGEGKGGWHLANLASSPKYLALLAGGIFIVAILGVGSFYYLKDKASKEVSEIIPSLPTPATSTVPVVNPEIPVVVEEPEIPVMPTSTEQEIPKEMPLEFPSILLSESVDMDNDGLTDLAEIEFGTDPGDYDTDKDNYPDGLEVYNLYNPKGFEPQRIAESGLVKEYKNNNFKYSLYIPINWAIGSVDEESRQVLFSTLSGENIEIRIFDLRPGEDFNAWFERMAIGQDLLALVDFETKLNFTGKVRNDGLVYYFLRDNLVYVVIYHVGETEIVNYKSVMSLMTRSLVFDVVAENDYLAEFPLDETENLDQETEEEKEIVENETTTTVDAVDLNNSEDGEEIEDL